MIIRGKSVPRGATRASYEDQEAEDRRSVNECTLKVRHGQVAHDQYRYWGEKFFRFREHKLSHQVMTGPLPPS